MACENGYYDVVKTLLGNGADANIARSDVSYLNVLRVEQHHMSISDWTD